MFIDIILVIYWPRIKKKKSWVNFSVSLLYQEVRLDLFSYLIKKQLVISYFKYRIRQFNEKIKFNYWQILFCRLSRYL